VHDFHRHRTQHVRLRCGVRPELSHGSAQNFENKWNDGKHQLQKQVQGIKDAIGNILDSFEKTDQDAVSNLDSGSGDELPGRFPDLPTDPRTHPPTDKVAADR